MAIVSRRHKQPKKTSSEIDLQKYDNLVFDEGLTATTDTTHDYFMRRSCMLLDILEKDYGVDIYDPNNTPGMYRKNAGKGLPRVLKTNKQESLNQEATQENSGPSVDAIKKLLGDK